MGYFMRFSVHLSTFSGPLDLLLYLVRKHELDVADIPIALVTEQYLEHLEILEQIDVNAVGEFLEMASRLIEIKSRLVLPQTEELPDELEDPRQDLVQHLLEYKQYRDAASLLAERSRQWQNRFPRVVDELPPRVRNVADQPIQQVELWDLVSALGRIMRDRVESKGPSSIRYDETPIRVFMHRIHDQLIHHQKLAFSQLFSGSVHRSTTVGMFLAVLELIRHRWVVTTQESLFGEIWIAPGERPIPKEFDNLSDVEEYTSNRAA